MGKEIEDLQAKVKELEQQLQDVTADRDGLKERGDSTSRVDELTQQVQALSEEKTQLEQRLREAEAASSGAVPGKEVNEAELVGIMLYLRNTQINLFYNRLH